MNSATTANPLDIEVLLVGNYRLDHYVSMDKFAQLMLRELRSRGYRVRICHPPVVLGRLWNVKSTIGKWLGYIDKFIFFPPLLRWAARSADVIHICDHSNAMYAKGLAGRHTVMVTCHDLLAVRGAMGEATDCPASRTGKMLQRWILSGLRRARSVPCVSSFTRDDARHLMSGRPLSEIPLVLNGLNYPFSPLSVADRNLRLAPWATSLNARPFVMHVGSNHARKNRTGVLRAFSIFSRSVDASLVFVGHRLPSEAHALAAELGISDRIIEISNPDDATLQALYTAAYALLFPSRYEGFGWPVIEAQACGCPVVCSDIPPFKEVVLESTQMCGADDVEGLAAALRALSNPEFRKQQIAQGLVNAARFTTNRMIDEYQDIYRSLTCATREMLGVPA